MDTPGNDHIRDVTKSVRLSAEQWRRVQQAASLETQRTGSQVYPTALLAEIGMDGIDAILARPASRTA